MVAVMKRLNSAALQGIIALPKELQQCEVEVTVRKAEENDVGGGDLMSLCGIIKGFSMTEKEAREERLSKV